MLLSNSLITAKRYCLLQAGQREHCVTNLEYILSFRTGLVLSVMYCVSLVTETLEISTDVNVFKDIGVMTVLRSAQVDIAILVLAMVFVILRSENVNVKSTGEVMTTVVNAAKIGSVNNVI